MRGLAITIIDVIGVFVPGLLLLAGLAFVPPVKNELVAFWSTAATGAGVPLDRFIVTVVVVAVAVVAYVLGFLNRLTSIRFLQLVQGKRWTETLQNEAAPLNAAFESAMKDEVLTDALKNHASRLGHRDPAFYAPYFHFAKRMARADVNLRDEVEKLEAEARFTAGLFIPLLVIFLDGLWVTVSNRTSLSTTTTVAAGIAIAIVLRSFPRRRVREVLYNYLLALIALRNANQTAK